MKNRLLRYWTLTLDLLMFALLLAAPVQAQASTEDHNARMAEREQRMEQRRARREEFMAENPGLRERAVHGRGPGPGFARPLLHGLRAG